MLQEPSVMSLIICDLTLNKVCSLAAGDFHQRCLGLCIILTAPAPCRHLDSVISVILIAVIGIMLMCVHAHLLTHTMHVLQRLSGHFWHNMQQCMDVSILGNKTYCATM